MLGEDGGERELFSRFQNALLLYQQESHRSTDDILEQLEEVHIPAAVLDNRRLGILESVVKFLREEHDYTLAKIAVLLKRDNRTIWSTYERARRKVPKQSSVLPGTVYIPVSVFSNRTLGVLEAVVVHLKESGMRYSAIARLLGRDARTIWTAYNRAQRK
jgi:hypothetical protein